MYSNREQDDLMALYADMSDLELRELHAGEADLTEAARFVLSDEIRKRNLDLDAPEPPSDSPEDETKKHVEYTWKTDLFTFRDSGEADRVTRALKLAGIESFIRNSQDTYGYASSGVTVQVAADQLEAAQAVLAQLTPEKLQASGADEEDPSSFEAPACPSCHANASLLVDTEPVNQWECDECNHTWSEGAST